MRVLLWVLTAITGLIGALLALYAMTTGDVLTGFGVTVMVVCLCAAVLFGSLARSVGASRPCPHCGKDVRKGRVVCPTCGFDFGTLLPGQAPPPDRSR